MKIINLPEDIAIKLSKIYPNTNRETEYLAYKKIEINNMQINSKLLNCKSKSNCNTIRYV